MKRSLVSVRTKKKLASQLKTGTLLGHRALTFACFLPSLSCPNLSHAFSFLQAPYTRLPHPRANTKNVERAPHLVSFSWEQADHMGHFLTDSMVISPCWSSFPSKDPAYLCPAAKDYPLKKKTLFLFGYKMLANLSHQRALLFSIVFLLNKAPPYQSPDLFLLDAGFLSLSFIFCTGKREEKKK